MLNALDESGLSVAAFAAREGFNTQRLYFWKRRFDASGTTASGPAFVEVRPRATESVEIVLRSGRVLRVATSIDGADLRRLVDALEHEGAC